MSLVVETGEGLENADSYVSIDEATAYVAAFYFPTDAAAIAWNAALEEDAADAEVALRRSTRDLDTIYAGSFVSKPLTSIQSLAFPRSGIDGIPLLLKNATIELALLALTGFDPIGPGDKSGEIESEKQKLGPLEVETKYFYPSDTVADEARKVSVLLAPLLKSSATAVNIDLVRG
jgi:hypothetical protein